jgi:citrate lyase subunit beta / citryl-CoA lyase
MLHPNEVLHGAQQGAVFLPACDHYCGVPKLIEKSLNLQRQLIAERGACVFDVTVDCEDGAPAGEEISHANALCVQISNHFDAAEKIALEKRPRIAVRVHPIDHPSFATDVQLLVAPHAKHWAHLMLPKVECRADVDAALAVLDAEVDKLHGAGAVRIPLHALIESPHAVHHAFDIAGHPRIASLSFGLMDFVSAHNGALADDAMSAQGQFSNPQVQRAKLEIAAACHAHGKVPSHCVVTEFNDLAAITQAAAQARMLGYTRMWSIHPNQIRPVLAAFAPSPAIIQKAAALLLQAQAANWAPIRFDNALHDRASYRLYWQQLQQANAAGVTLPDGVLGWF